MSDKLLIRLGLALLLILLMYGAAALGEYHYYQQTGVHQWSQTWRINP